MRTITLSPAAARLIEDTDGVVVVVDGKTASVTLTDDGINAAYSTLADIVDGEVAAPKNTVRSATAALVVLEQVIATIYAEEVAATISAEEAATAAAVVTVQQAEAVVLSEAQEQAAASAVEAVTGLASAEGAVEGAFHTALVAVAQAQALGVPNARLTTPDANAATIGRYGLAGRALLIGGEQPTDLGRSKTVARFVYSAVIKGIKGKVTIDSIGAAIDGSPTTAAAVDAILALVAAPTPPVSEGEGEPSEGEPSEGEEFSDTRRALLATRGALIALVAALPVKGCWDADEQALLAEIDGLLAQVNERR